MNQSANILTTLLLFGLMGLIGQGIRAVIGLKNAALAQASNPTAQSSFNAAYLFVSLMIGFIAGIVAGLALNWNDVTGASGIDMKTLLGLVAAGYAGADFIENSFSSIIPGLTPPPAHATSSPISGDILADVAPGAGKKVVFATHLIGSGQAIASADGIIAMLNNGPTGGRANQAKTGTESGNGSGGGDQKDPSGASQRPQALLPSSKDWTSAELIRDMQEALKYATFIKSSSLTHNLAASLICAVGSRESNWGLSPDMRPKGPAGTGDWAPRHGKMPPDGLGWGRGLMQADYAASAFAKDAAEWTDPRQNIEFGCNELASDLQHYKTRFADLPEAKQLQAAIAAYNTGPGNVDRSLSKGRDVDSTTAGHDYSADVLSRAAWFKAKGFDDHVATT